jgi:hypothetical protein
VGSRSLTQHKLSPENPGRFKDSAYVDPHDDEKIAFRDLPNRFPSVLSRDFRKEEAEYQDTDNLFAMYLLYNLGKYRVAVDERTKRLEIDGPRAPMPYREAAKLAAENAKADSASYRRRPAFRPRGRRIGDVADAAGGP